MTEEPCSTLMGTLLSISIKRLFLHTNIHFYAISVMIQKHNVLCFQTISLHDRWVAYRGESTRSQDKLFMAKRGSLVRLKKTLKVFLATSRKGDSCDFKIKGSWFDKSFIIYTGKTNIVVAEVSKQEIFQIHLQK